MSREHTPLGQTLLRMITVLLGGGLGCGGADDPGLGRQYDTLVSCWGPPPLEEALARVDVNDDGRLSPDDLLAGEVVFLLRTHGAHVDSQTPDIERVSIHSDWDAYIQRDDNAWVLQATAACHPTARVTFRFETSDTDPGERFDARFTGFGFHALDAMATTRHPEVQGSIVGSAAAGALSGVLEGFASGALHSEVPDAFGRSEMTGQVVHLEALAFRDVEVVP